MSVGLSPGDFNPTVPISLYETTPPPPASSSTPGTIPANASAPVWQPWATTQASAQSVLNTQIDRALKVYDGQLQAAQRMLDNAEAIATRQAKPLETAAWAAWNSYMQAAEAVYNASMEPALAAYTKAIQLAHDTLTGRLDPVEHAYARAAADATWTNNLANGGATL